jgi:hypothetical protein
MIARNAILGFHAPSLPDGTVPAEGLAVISDYLRSLGFRQDAIWYMTQRVRHLFSLRPNGTR